MSHPQKIPIPCVEFERVRVWVFKTRFEIRLMNEVRTVLRVAPGLVLILRGIHDRASLLRIQQLETGRRSLFGRRSLRLHLCSLGFSLCGWRSLRSRSRAPRHPSGCQTHRNRNSACHSPIELSLRFVHCLSAFGRCRETVSPSLRIYLRLGSAMELALSVIGQMASWPIGFKIRWVLELCSSGGLGVPGILLVHCYFDRCGVAEVA